MNVILLNMNQQRVTLLVLLDLSAALDTVHQAILLDRLHTHFGISGHAHSWFKSYLHNRCQSISTHGGKSKRFEGKYGVPHGSCLGTLLFVLYSSKLFTTIVHAYTDDTELYISFKANSSWEQSAVLRTCKKVLLTSEIGCYLTGQIKTKKR